MSAIATRRLMPLIVLAGLLAACGTTEPEAPILVDPPRVEYDGETLFSALVFGRGPATAVLPEFAIVAPPPEYGVTAAQMRDADGAIALLMQHTRADEPTFFGRFGQRLKSGDPVQVAEALDEAAGILARVVREVAPSPQAEEPPPIVVVEVVVTVTAVFNVLAVANISVAYNQTLFWGLRNPNDAASALRRDHYAALIADRLS